LEKDLELHLASKSSLEIFMANNSLEIQSSVNFVTNIQSSVRHQIDRLRALNHSKWPYFMGAIVYLSLALRNPVAIWTDAVHDDQMFISGAMWIASTGWLGPYDQYTLAKGPGFSIFLALNSLIGIPITLLLALLFLAASYCLAVSLMRAGAPPLGSLITFLFLIFNPLQIPTRILRDDLYATLTIFAVVMGLELFLVSRRKRTTVAMFLALGGLFGFFYLTREEFVWIFPFIGFLALFWLLRGKKELGKLDFWKPLLAVLAGFTAPVLSVALLNGFNYGLFQTNDFTQGAFASAYNQLEEVSAGGQTVPYVPVPKDVRDQIYSVSPAFAELRDYFEGSGLAWTTFGCEFYKENCGDYQGTWFVWALRDAVEQKGYYESAKSARNFYERLENEVRDACNTGELKCGFRVIPFIPKLEPGQIMSVLESIPRFLEFAIKPGWSLGSVSPSTGSTETLYSTSKFLGSPNSTLPSTQEGYVRVSGWYDSMGWLTTNCGKEVTEIPRVDSPDLVTYFQDDSLEKSRFIVDVAAQLDCELVGYSKNGEIVSQETWRELALNDGFFEGLHIDSVDSFDPKIAYLGASRVQQFLGDTYSSISRILLPATFLLHLALLALAALKRQYWLGIRRLIIAYWGVGIVFLTRVMLLAIVDATSFPGLNLQYLLPGVVLVPILCAVPILCLWVVLRQTQGIYRGDGLSYKSPHGSR